MISRKAVVTCARSYLGTPFQHQGRIKGRAMDCVGLLLCVADELQLLDVEGRGFRASEYLNYSSQPLDRFIEEECKRRLLNVTARGLLLPGYAITMKLPDIPCHVGIVTDVCYDAGVIHAYAGGSQRVVEHILDAKWRRRIESIFAFPGVDY